MSNAMDPKYEYEVAAAIYPEPLALFEKDPDWQPTCFHDYRLALSSAVTFGVCRMAVMYLNRRPVYSGKLSQPSFR